MAAPEPFSGVSRVSTLLERLSNRLDGLPAEQSLAFKEDLQKIQAEFKELLAVNGARHRWVTEKIFEGFFELDENWCFIFVNPRAASSLGRTPAELIGKNIWESFPSMLGTQQESYYRQVMEKRQPINFEMAATLTNQWYNMHVYPSSTGIIVFWMDITERKHTKAELRQYTEALRKSEEKFSRIFRTSPIALAISTLEEGRLVEVNDSFLNLYGYSRDEVIGHTTIELGMISPEDRQLIIRSLQASIPFRNFEVKGRARSGEVRYTLFSTEPFDIDGKTHLLSVILDITDRKLSEVFDHALNDISKIIHSSHHFDQVVARSIAAAAQALGSDSAAFSLRSDDHWRVRGVYNFPETVLGMELNDDQERHGVLAMRTQQPVAVSDAFNDERFNREHLRKWGIRSVLVMPVVVKDEAIGVIFFNYQQSACEFKQVHIDFVNQLTASLSLALENARLYQSLEEEIEERKRVEAALRAGEKALQEIAAELQESEAAQREAAAKERARANELQAVMDAAPAIIWISRDPECREMTGNRYSYDFLNIRPGENVSKTASNEAMVIQSYHMEKDGRIIPPEELPIQVAAAVGKPARDYTADIVYEDGSRYNLIGNVNALLNEDGQPYGAIGVFTDVTALRRLEAEQITARAEIEVQRRLMDQREQDRQSIARDLHDGPIQTLSSSTFHLHLIKQAFPDPALEVELNQVGMDIKNTIHELREVLNDLRPPALMHFGFSRVIQFYTEDLRERFPDLEIELDVMDDGKHLPDQARLALFRIYQEGVNNIVRHSSASKIWVMYRVEQDRFRLELRDNGKGFENNQDFAALARSGHFGLVGMKERAEAIGAQFSISSEPGKGAIIVVSGALSTE